MRIFALFIPLVLVNLLFISGCATVEEKDKKQDAAAEAIAAATEAIQATTEAGNEWRDTGKLLKYAKKLYDLGKKDKALLLANKAKRQADIATAQANYEHEKYWNNLSQKDRDELTKAQGDIEQIKKDEMAESMSAQVTASKVAEPTVMMSEQKLTTARAVVSEGADSYTVISGDTLWAIAGKDEVYSNSYQWPLIYKTNRSIIKDADKIYPGQNFDISRDVSAVEINDAVQYAKKRGAWAIDELKLDEIEQLDAEYLSK